MPTPISLDNLAAQKYGYTTSNMTTSFSDAYYNHIAFVDGSSSNSISDSNYLFNASNTLLTSSKVIIAGSGTWLGNTTLQRYKTSSYSSHGYYLFNNSTSASDSNARRVYTYFIVPTTTPTSAGYNIPIFSAYTSTGYYINFFYGYNSAITGYNSSHVGFYFFTSKYNDVFELKGNTGNNYALTAGNCYSITISHYADDTQIFVIDLGVNASGTNNSVTTWPSSPTWYASTVDHTYRNGTTKVSYSSSTSPATGTTAYYTGVSANGFIKTAILAAFKSGGSLETSTYYALSGRFGGLMVLTYAYNKTAADTKSFISSIARQRPYKVILSNGVYTLKPLNVIATGLSFVVASTTASRNTGYYLSSTASSSLNEYQRGSASFYSSSSYAYYSSSVQTLYTATFSTAYGHVTWTPSYGTSCTVPSGNYIAFKTGLKKNGSDLQPQNDITLNTRTTTPPSSYTLEVDSTIVDKALFGSTTLAAVRYVNGSTVYCPHYGKIETVRMNPYSLGSSYAIRIRRATIKDIQQFDTGIYYILPRSASSTFGPYYDFRVGDKLYYLICSSTSTTGTETQGGYFNQSLIGTSTNVGAIMAEGTGRTHNRVINPTTNTMTYYSVVEPGDILGYRALVANSTSTGASYTGTYYHWGCPSSAVSTAYSTLQSTNAYVSSGTSCGSSTTMYVSLG